MPAEAAREWTGDWISVAGAAATGLHRVGFRRDVRLAAVPPELPIRISADSRYVLWVNGVEVGRGPVRGQQYRWTYDEYDIAPHLVEGANTIAALVTYYGQENAMWQRARVGDGLGSAACLIVDAPSGFENLSTGTSWTARTLTEWSAVSGAGILAALPIEVIDMREHDAAWFRPAHDPTGFAPAARARALHPGSSHRSRPPVYPYGGLLPRGMAALGGDTVSPNPAWVHQVVHQVAPQVGEDPAPDPVDKVLQALETLGPQPGTSSPAPSVAAPGEPLVWQFDFGRIVSGFVELDFDAPAGTVFDLAYLERPFGTGESSRYVPRAGARVIAAGGPGQFRALETNGLRVAAVLVTPPEPAAVTISGLRVREHLYPFSGAAEFSSSDPELERLWRAGVRTVQLNSVDSFTDCPTREQRAWVGDAVIHLGVHLIANEDWRLAERHLALCDSPRADGLLPMSVAGDIESAGRYSIPEYSLHWLHGLWLYARTSKRLDVVRTHLPTAERMLGWFEQYERAGILTDVPEWAVIDWASVFVTGQTAILTALWARGLREFAELSSAVGNTGSAAVADGLARRVERAFSVFWDEARGLYVDHIVDGERMPAASQATNAAAIVAGLVPTERREALVLRITDETSLVTRGWNAASPTVSLAQKTQDRANGVQRIDWDVQREIVRAEPFVSAIVHDAVAMAGRADVIPDLLRRWSRFLHHGYDTFGECWEWGTPVHGWSSTPTRDLVVHVLGIAPLDLTSDDYRIAPVRTDIERLSASVPTRLGLLRADLRAGWLELDSPVGVHVQLWNGEIVSLDPGRVRVDMSGTESRKEPLSLFSGIHDYRGATS